LMALPASKTCRLEMIPMKIETQFDSNYRKVLVAARRARQIQNGSAALVPTHSTKACRIAQDEVEAGKIAYVKKDIPVVKPLVEESGIPIISS
jgi:DNA-directed RNA polymerase subunit omega